MPWLGRMPGCVVEAHGPGSIPGAGCGCCDQHLNFGPPQRVRRARPWKFPRLSRE